jgi:hypothetical protein
MSTFALQVNDSGAWRNVVKGNKEQMQSIEHHAAMIAQDAGKQYKWRIIDAAFGTVIGYCNADTDYIWVPAK